MLIFVPPSETKAFPAQAAPVELGSLLLPELTPVRARLLKALVRVARGRAPAALVPAVHFSGRAAGAADPHGAARRAPLAVHRPGRPGRVVVG